ncbi:MAG: ABC transporter ATP-binding protein [Alphaproteobacteria bacterium]|nr:ABC transporter ATP-binding protein [Alphaproteobacteria bacterium]
MTSLTIENVVKRFDGVLAIDDVSLRVEAGQRIALLGHNGAGKTTLMRMILGLTPLSAGRIEVLGGLPGSRKARKLTGFLPESVAFHGALSGREQVRHFARLKSVPMKDADNLLERVGLSKAADRRIRTYSKGMRQRVGLAQALIGRPKLALLDEPTSGLDPISRHEFYEIVQELAADGTAVLLSSHALTELETSTDRLVILSGGRLVANDNLANLRRAARLPIRLNVTGTTDAVDQLAARLGGQRLNGCSVELTCQQDEKLGLLGQITGLGDLVTDVDVIPASLEDLYRYYSVSGMEGE